MWGLSACERHLKTFGGMRFLRERLQVEKEEEQTELGKLMFTDCEEEEKPGKESNSLTQKQQNTVA